MPFNFVCKLIDYIKQIEFLQSTQICIQNRHKLDIIIDELYDCKFYK
jgi:hypothetical protein